MEFNSGFKGLMEIQVSGVIKVSNLVFSLCTLQCLAKVRD